MKYGQLVGLRPISDWSRKRSDDVFNFFKSNEEKREEQISAYIDQQMTAAERQSFEALLAGDADLREQVEGRQEVKALLSQMPKLKAPRNFVLDPAVYGGKAPAPSLLEMLYPKMRVATAAAAFLFVIIFGAGVLLPSASLNVSPTADVAMAPLPEPQLEELVVEQEVVAIEAEDGAIQSRGLVEEADEAAMADAEVAPQAADLDEASGAAESFQLEIEESSVIESPREAESDAIEGERLSEPEPIPTATVDVASNEVAVAPVEEAVETTSGEDFTRVEDTASQIDWLSISLWGLGILTIVLILSTFIIGRRVD